MSAEISSGAEAGFQAYEAAVLPLLPRHGGLLERRLRTDDALVEIHPADEERQSHKGLLEGLGVTQRVLRVNDVTVP